MIGIAARVCLLAGLVGSSLALVPGGRALASDAEDARREYWVERHQKLTADHARFSTRLDTARARYGRGRRDNRLRGETKVEVLADIVELETQLGRTESAIASFDDDARRAGALPGWFAKLPPLPELGKPAARRAGAASTKSSTKPRPEGRRDREASFRRRP